MFPDYYKRLGLNKNTTRGEIKKAYRTYALKYHPDRNKNEDAHDLFIKINEAYSILYDKQARAKYDIEYRNHFSRAKAESYNRHEYTYQKAETSEEYRKRQQSYREGQYTYEADNPFEDENLNKKAKKAKKQGAEYAAMAFVNFSNQIAGMIKSTFELIKNIFLTIVYGLFGLAGILIMLFGLVGIGVGVFSNWELSTTLVGIFITVPGFLLLRASDRNNILFKSLHVGLGVFGIILTLLGSGHISLHLITSGELGDLTFGIVILIIGVLTWRSVFKKLEKY